MDYKQFFQDSTGTYSSARLINIAVAAAAIVICFWLTYKGVFTEGYFLALLAYGGGVASYGKFVEARKTDTGQQANADRTA